MSGSLVLFDAPDVTYVLRRSIGLRVLSVCTERNHPALVNFRVSLERLGYEYEILGLGERWGGWKWRTKKYLNALEQLRPEALVLLSDCTDVLFVEPPEELERRFKALKVPIAIGGERGLSTGKYRYDLPERRRVRDRYRERKPMSSYRFPNAGLIIGYVAPLLRLLYMNRDAEDDQAGLVELYDMQPNIFYIDTDMRLFGNLVQRAPFFDDDLEVYERAKWRVEWTLDIPHQSNTIRECRRYARLVNNETNGAPCILHFAGGNWESYNEVGPMLLGPIHQPVYTTGNEHVRLIVKKSWTGALSWLVSK